MEKKCKIVYIGLTYIEHMRFEIKSINNIKINRKKTNTVVITSRYKHYKNNKKNK